MQIEASASSYTNGKPSLHQHCERLVLQASRTGDTALLAAIYNGVALGHWNGLRDILEEAQQGGEG